MPVTAKSSIFYGMRASGSNTRSARLALAAVVFAAVASLAVIACDGGDNRPAVTAEPNVTPGTGISPVEAVGTYITLNGLDGRGIDPTKLAECPLSDDILATPGIVSRFAIAQFCFTAKDLVPQESIVMTVELPETGEVWDFRVAYDIDSDTWTVTDIDKTSD